MRFVPAGTERIFVSGRGNLSDIAELRRQAMAEVDRAADLASLEGVRQRWLGPKGVLTLELRTIGSRPPEERKAFGEAANRLKGEVAERLEARLSALRAAALDLRLAAEREDLTLPPRRVRLGRLHPLTQTIREVSRIFATMGFETVEGPEVEWDHYNFELLNIPQGHPARDKFNTLWISNPLGGDPDRPVLLRTHTSPMQARVMEARKPPIRVIVPGRVYRFEATDAYHESVFFQFEGLAVDDRITMADLKGVLYSFARQMFGGERKIRFRPDYFPFTEPSAEIAIDCFVCGGTGGECRTCGGSGWLEMGGCGMVHPNVLRGVGYDPSKTQGFAFGCGVERIAMLRSGTPDIRLFQQNDLRYLEGF
ncbi:MAG: phenylalanine--tRNA ligase subunit alpha [Chloroflexi bacterium]|nr:phenylalanine--tRNA ligase subunit alpha [Chloroflexota bacterium]